jgi:hypothetical protein
VGWEIMNHLPYSTELVPSDQNFQPMMNWNAVSWTGYAVRIKPFMLQASVTW